MYLFKNRLILGGSNGGVVRMGVHGLSAGREVLPKGGDVGPWKARVNYFKDFWDAKFGGTEGLEFASASETIY